MVISTLESHQMGQQNLAFQSCVVFLDFDGVTHPEPCRSDALFCFLPRIEEVLREHPEVDIVISSSWRLEFSLEQLRGHFSADIASRVVGVTPSNKQPGVNWLPEDMNEKRSAKHGCAKTGTGGRPGWPWTIGLTGFAPTVAIFC